MTKLIPVATSVICLEDYERTRVARAFGVTLQNTRLRQGMSQDYLSKRCGLDRTYPSLLERGLRCPTLNMFLLLAHGLEVHPQQPLADTIAQLHTGTSP